MAEIIKNNEEKHIVKGLTKIEYTPYINNSGNEVRNDFFDMVNSTADAIGYRLCTLYKPDEIVAQRSNMCICDSSYITNQTNYNPANINEPHFFGIENDTTTINGTTNLTSDVEDAGVFNTLKIGRFAEWENSVKPSGTVLHETNTKIAYALAHTGTHYDGAETDTTANIKPHYVVNGGWRVATKSCGMEISNISCDSFTGPKLKLGFNMIAAGTLMKTLVSNDSYVAIGFKGLTQVSNSYGGAIGIYKVNTDLHAKKIKDDVYLLHIDDVTLGNMDLFTDRRFQYDGKTNTASIFVTNPRIYNVLEYFQNTSTNSVTGKYLFNNTSNITSSEIKSYYVESIVKPIGNGGTVSRQYATRNLSATPITKTYTSNSKQYFGIEIPNISNNWTNAMANYVKVAVEMTIPAFNKSATDTSTPIIAGVEIKPSNYDNVYQEFYDNDAAKQESDYRAEHLTSSGFVVDTNSANRYANEFALYSEDVEFYIEDFSEAVTDGYKATKYVYLHNGYLRHNCKWNDINNVFLRSVTKQGWCANGDITVKISLTAGYK